MHSTTNYLIVNLAIADILFVGFCAPYTAYEYSTIVWGLGDVACKLFNYLVHVTLHISVFTLVLMAVDRFIAVVFPVSGMSLRTDRNTFIAIALLWVVSLSGLAPVIFYFEESFYVHQGVEKSTCMIIGSHMSNVIFTVGFFSTFTVNLLIHFITVGNVCNIVCHPVTVHNLFIWRDAFKTLEECSWKENSWRI